MHTVIDSFASVLHSQPDRPLIHLASSGVSITAARIWESHRAAARMLTDAGLQPGQLILSLAGNRAAAVPLLLAARAAGLALMPLDAGTPAAEIDELAARYGAAATVLPAGAAVAPGRQTYDLLGELTLAMAADPVAARSYPGVAAMKLTSGSTGAPKATLTSEAQLVIDSRQIAMAMQILPDDTQMAVIPLSHAYGLSVLLVPLLLQGTAIVLRESFVPTQFAGDVERFSANSFPGVPFMFQHFLAHEPAAWPAQIRRVMSAGARLPPDTAQQFHQRFDVKIHSFYGTTETGGIAYDSAPDETGEETVGWPLPGVTVSFTADSQAPAGSGRLHVKGGGVSNGYAHGDDEAFCDGGYLTGDYGYVDEHGRLRLTGRISSFVNVAGRKVQPEEVERVLRTMPGVRDVRVIAAADPLRGEQVVACIVPAVEHGDGMTRLRVRRFCSARLAPHKIPRVIVFLEAIPLSARGKVDRQALDAIVRAELQRVG